MNFIQIMLYTRQQITTQEPTLLKLQEAPMGNYLDIIMNTLEKALFFFLTL